MPDRDHASSETTVTDARFPERWMHDRRLRRLTGDGFRLFMMGMAWSVSQRTDGVIEDADLQGVPYVDASLIGDIEAAGLWRRDGDRWIIEDFATTQTARRELERLEAIRRADRERKSRQRSQAEPREVPPDISEDVRADAPRLGKAKARPGEEDLPAPSETSENHRTLPVTALAGDPCSRCGRASSFSLMSGLCRKCRYG